MTSKTPSQPAAWRLSDLTFAEVRHVPFNVAVLPLGSTEPHNLHLPHGTDTIESDALADAICAYATSAGARVTRLPTIPYGTQTNMLKCPLAININPSTLNRFVRDIVDSLENHGIKRIVLLNSHGGNDLKPLLRELAGCSKARMFSCFWPRVLTDVYGTIFEKADDHAGEMETSLMLALAPDLVRREPDGRLRADDGATRATRFEALEQGWVSITRPWHLLTTNTGSGNPHAASAAKGHKAIALIAERIGSFVADLSKAETDDCFPFLRVES